MKPIQWLGSSRTDLKAFPSDPNDWKPLRIVGPGVREIRVHTGREHRVVYVATFAEAVYVLHAFAKKTAKTATRGIRLARTRFEVLLAEKRGSHAP